MRSLSPAHYWETSGGESKTTFYIGGNEVVLNHNTSKTDFKRHIAGKVIVTLNDWNSRSGNAANTDTKYLLRDHLGSVISILNNSGSAQEMSFDPWGQRNSPTDWRTLLGNYPSNPAQFTAITNRGFTGHEMVDTMGLIHMNGRIYDPKLARFMQADPFVQSPDNTQSHNHYSYVLNNPLAFTDPSGYLFDPVGQWTKKKVTSALGYETSSAIVSIGATFCGPWAPACAAYGKFDLARTFDAPTSDAIKAGIVGGVSQWAFGDNSGAPTWGDAAIQLGLNVVAAENPALGQALMFVNGNWNDPSMWVQNAVGATLQYHASRKLAQEAARHGLTLQEFNLILALNSKVGLVLAGDAYDPEAGTITGFFTRQNGLMGSSGKWLGGFWDINDSLLNAQGLLDAVSLQAIHHKGKLQGHSLGAWRVNNLQRQGFTSNSELLSLPFFSYPASGSNGYCISTDPICGGNIMNLFRPDTAPLHGAGFNSHDRSQYLEQIR